MSCCSTSKIDWDWIDREIAPLCGDKGWLGTEIRLCQRLARLYNVALRLAVLMKANITAVRMIPFTTRTLRYTRPRPKGKSRRRSAFRSATDSR